MALNINKVTSNPTSNFIGTSSAKPIVGVAVRTAYAYNISQAKLTLGASDIATAGAPVQVKNTNLNSTAAGRFLSPNVLSAELAVKTTKPEDGFLLVSDTDILDFGDTAPTARNAQVVYVGLLGSGVEVYLPADNSLAGITMSSTLAWDYDVGALKVSAIGKIKPLSPVLDGVKIAVESGAAVYKDCKVIKVKL